MASHSYSISSTSRCYGCLSTNTERQLQTYLIKKLILKTIIQMDQLILCYICKRVAIQTEKFIHNVETSQELFADTKNELKLSSKNYKTILHPLINLTYRLPKSENVLVLKSYESNNYGIKDEFEDTSFHSTEVAEIKKEEQAQDSENCYHQEKIIDINQGPETADYSCTNRDSDQQDDNHFDNDISEQIEDDFKYSTRDGNQKKTTEKEFCAEIITLTKEQVKEERLQRAMEAKYAKAAFKCEHCIKGFVMKTPYENHMKLHDKERGEIECDICKQRLKSQYQLDLHYRYHIERYKCSKCDETRNCWMSLKDHYLRKHSDGHYEYSCPVCFKQFRFRSSFQKHKADKHENRERVKCKYCDKTFASDSAIGYHLKFNHTNEELAQLKPYTCTECGRSFKMLPKLKAHMVTHSNVRNHYCVECDKSFKTRTALNLHFRTVVAHNKSVDRQELLLPCPECGKRFPHSRALSRHVKAVHLNQTLLQCSQCGKTFKNKKNLTVHIMAHDGYEQPKKHCCTICNKRFHEKGVLAKHMNTHTGEKPFQCSQCPAHFAHSGSLYNHVRLVHLNLTRKGTPKGPGLGASNRKTRN